MPTKAKIAQLNDAMRAFGTGGSVMATAGFMALDGELKVKFLREIRKFNTFNADNDPYGEHDFGSINLDNTTVFWKIDYYAKDSYDFGSEDPADASKTNRVMTIMLASDY